jgi:hypothetical protein
MSDLEMQAPAITPAPRTIGRAVLTFRILATLNAVLVVLQPFWIGFYLDGQYGALQIHEIGGTAVQFTALLQMVPAIWYAVVARHRVRVPILAFLLLLGVGAQTGFGYGRLLAVHIPLGVAVVVGSLAFAVWTWARAGTATPRNRRVKRAGPDRL